MQNVLADVVARLVRLDSNSVPKSPFILGQLCKPHRGHKLQIWFVFGLILTSCASTKPEFEVVTPHYDVEYVTIEQELTSAVNSTSSRFTLNSLDDLEAWTRANLFFKEYTDSFVRSPEKLASTPGLKNRYRYEVIKSFDRSSGVVSYAVRCGPPAGNSALNQKAIQNAKNVARFIKEGNLELSILDR